MSKLESTDTKVRLAALEQLLGRIKSRPLTEFRNDALVRVLSAVINTLKDANPKVILLSLDCVQLLLNAHGDSFQSLVNMCFEMLLSKLSDGKLNVRTRATQVMVDLISMLGLSAGFEKLGQQMSHKNFHVKEHILYTVLLLYRQYGDDIIAIPNLCVKLGVLLSDNQNSVRQLATDTLAAIHLILGDSLLVGIIPPSQTSLSYPLSFYRPYLHRPLSSISRLNLAPRLLTN